VTTANGYSTAQPDFTTNHGPAAIQTFLQDWTAKWYAASGTLNGTGGDNDHLDSSGGLLPRMDLDLLGLNLLQGTQANDVYPRFILID
jgi:hypothetical protein